MKKYSAVKKWYDLGYKTLDGEKILLPEKDILYSDCNWIEDKPRVLFKAISEVTSVEGEVLFQYIARDMGIDSIIVRPAHLVQKSPYKWLDYFMESGVLSEDYVKNRKTQKDIAIGNMQPFDWSQENSVEEDVEIIKAYAKELQKQSNKKVVINENIENQLKAIFFIDYLTLQGDRHVLNISVVTTQKAGEIFINLAKCYDNSQIFGFANEKKSKYLENLSKRGKEKKINKSVDSSYMPKFFMSKTKYVNPLLSYTNIQANEIARNILGNKYLYEMYTKALSVNFEKIKQQMKDEIEGYNFPEMKLNLASVIFKHRLSLITKEICALKEKESKKAKTIKDEDIKNLFEV